MALHDDLLALARALVPDHPAPLASAPLEANLRRGVSTAYYALFHLLVGEAMSRIVADSNLRSLVARSFQHDRMKSVCQEYSEATRVGTGPLIIKSEAVIPVQLQNIGSAFVSLQKARHQADYDTGMPFLHPRADRHVLAAEVAFLDWVTIKDDPAAAIFLTELFLRSVTRRQSF